MTQTTTPVGINSYSGYVHNCQRNRQCEPSFLAPVPTFPNLQLYVDFGAYKPALAQFYLKDVCTDAEPEQIFPNNFVVGQTPEGNWYGVFKYFDTPVTTVTSFVVWLSVLVSTPSGLQERTFFSEMLMIEPCDPLMKVKSCQPEGATTTGFDVNGLYYGLPVNVDYLGIAEVRYFHIVWVRQGKVRELANKATFTSSLYLNFRTVIEKTFQLETELVPKWFKDMLLAIYARGAIQINNVKTYIVSDLNFEALNEDDLRWKPFAQLKETFRLYYGCDESACVECCSPTVLGAFNDFTPESPSDESPGDESPVEPPCESLVEWDFTEEGGIGGQGGMLIAVNGTTVVNVANNASGSFSVQEGDEIVATVIGQSGTTRDVAVAGDHTDSDTSTSGNAQITFEAGCEESYFITGSVTT